MATLFPVDAPVDARSLAASRRIGSGARPPRRGVASEPPSPAIAAPLEAIERGHPMRDLLGGLPSAWLHRARALGSVALARQPEPGDGAARERDLSRSTDHADFERRYRAWEAHDDRLRRLPPVL